VAGERDGGGAAVDERERNRGHTYVFVSHDRGVVLIEFADLPKSEYGWAGMESTLKAVVESLGGSRVRIGAKILAVGFSCPSPLMSCDLEMTCVISKTGEANS
jgi:hypothetical protein